MRFALSLAALSIGGLLALPPLASANDDGSTISAPAPCPTGQVYSEQKKMCINAQSGIVDDKTLLAYASALSREERYDEALSMLDLLQNPQTAEALNHRGYATRKLGRIEEGIGYYLQSVALDPDYTLVREYLGEAYVIQGNLPLAREQLAEIEKRCGTTCEPYHDLAEAIADAAT